MLLTILGEYVLGSNPGVWQETLVDALGALDYQPQAARQALTRSVAAGWLQKERHGRRARVSLSAETEEMLRTGSERIYGFGKAPEWDGGWLLVLLRVPEERRDVRHQLRTRLAWAGFGSLGGGLWITPHVDRESELTDLSVDGTAAEMLSFRAGLGEVGEPERVITAAWDLDAVADAYSSFISRFARLRPKSLEAVFRAQTLLVHEWRKFPFLDPDLPELMLPKGWARTRAYALFMDRHAQWQDGAQEYFRSLEERTPLSTRA